MASSSSMRLGGGGRFRKLSTQLAARGAKNPDALAAWVGRERLGADKFNSLAHKALVKKTRGY